MLRLKKAKSHWLFLRPSYSSHSNSDKTHPRLASPEADIDSLVSPGIWFLFLIWAERPPPSSRPSARRSTFSATASSPASVASRTQPVCRLPTRTTMPRTSRSMPSRSGTPSAVRQLPELEVSSSARARSRSCLPSPRPVRPSPPPLPQPRPTLPRKLSTALWTGLTKTRRTPAPRSPPLSILLMLLSLRLPLLLLAPRRRTPVTRMSSPASSPLTRLLSRRPALFSLMRLCSW